MWSQDLTLGFSIMSDICAIALHYSASEDQPYTNITDDIKQYNAESFHKRPSVRNLQICTKFCSYPGPEAGGRT
jgi:hypothetical protein